MQPVENVSLKPYNTFGMEVYAASFCVTSSIESLIEALQYAKVNNLPFYILGGGSNILFTRNVNGLVIKNEIPGITMLNETNDYVLVKAGAGINWHTFVQYCLFNNYAGVENLSLIPGNVGASPMQNIGAYGVEIKDVFHSLTAVDVENYSEVTFYANECEFGYRESVFKNKLRNKFVITDVTYRLNKQPSFNTAYGAIEMELEHMGITNLTIQAISQAVINIRKSKLPDPAITGNAGSFFKNPEVSLAVYEQLQKLHPAIPGFPSSTGKKIPAAWLIEQCGWKGYRKNDAGCHPKQPLVLVNYGNAAGNDILSLSIEIQQSVFKQFGIQLQREVNVV